MTGGSALFDAENTDAEALIGMAEGNVLVVEDEEANRKFLRDLLEAHGHRVCEAADGVEALAKAAEEIPDAVLLDVLMPGLDGREVCRRLRRSSRTAHIPVLMITALADREARIAGIAAGATDFIVKPVDAREVVMRVRNAVQAKRLFDRLQESCRRLRETQRLRDDLADFVVRDMKGPLTAITTALQLLGRVPPAGLSAAQAAHVSTATQSAELLLDMIQSLLDLGRFEAKDLAPRKVPCNLDEVIEKALRAMRPQADLRQVAMDWSPGRHDLACDPDLVRRVVMNLLAESLRAAPPKARLLVEVVERPGGIETSVTRTDDGVGSACAVVGSEGKEAAGNGIADVAAPGLGLRFCRLAVEAHGGRLGEEAGRGRAKRQWFVLPRGTGAGASDPKTGRLPAG